MRRIAHLSDLHFGRHEVHVPRWMGAYDAVEVALPGRLMGAARSARDRVGILFRGPGWRPDLPHPLHVSTEDRRVEGIASLPGAGGGPPGRSAPQL